MSTFAVALPYDRPPLTANGMRGMHWGVRKSLTKAIRAWVAEGVTKLEAGPVTFVRVELHYVPRDSRRRDRDNLVPTLKPCLDGIVDAGLVPDDTPDYIDYAMPIIHKPDRDAPVRLYLLIHTTTEGQP